MAKIIEHEHRFSRDIYTVKVDGADVKVTVAASASVARRWLGTTLHFRRRYVYLDRLVVGLGVQWTPGCSDPPPNTLQLCIGHRCLIFQLTLVGSVPRSLRTFLNHHSHTFVGFWNYWDRRKLESSAHGLKMQRDPLDLRHCTETEDDENLRRASVEEIIEKCLDYEVERKREISMSHWHHKYLSHNQIAYATVDAYCAFLIGRNSRVWQLNR